MAGYETIAVAIEGHLATVELCRPPNNFFDIGMVRELAQAFESLDADPQCRAIVLGSRGKAFCAGANFSAPERAAPRLDMSAPGNLYVEGVRLFRCRKPVVAAVHGPAVGGGLGLALAADFRVTCPGARFSANFSRLGVHCGFGISVTLPRVVGAQQAALLLYTGRRIGGEEAAAIGLADRLVPDGQVREAAVALAREIAESSPLAVMSMRETLRAGLADAVAEVTTREAAEQARLSRLEDFREGVAAMAERRLPQFRGR